MVTESSPLSVVDHEVHSASRLANALAAQLQGRTRVIPAVLSGVPHPAAQEFTAALTEARSRHDAGLQALTSYFYDAATGLSDFDSAADAHESKYAALFRGEL